MILRILHNLSDFSILLITVALVTAVIVAAPHIGRHILRIPENTERDDAAFDAFKAIMSMIGVVLAFSLVQANGNLHTVETTVGKEAATLVSTDRVLLRIGNDEFAKLRPLLATYGQKLVSDEWPKLATGDSSETVDDAYAELSRKVRALGPEDTRQQAMYNELLKNLDDLSDVREAIIADSELHLSEFFWVTISAFLVLGIVLATLTTNSLSRTVGVGATAAAVALLLAFVIIVDRPFEGETSVSPRPIINALTANEHRA